jgi:glycosyltransferase involved in cell wall biosynthesis
MSSVLFYDPVCAAPYDTRTLASRALGGTEATLVRVADALDAYVVQHNRGEDWQRYRHPKRLPGITNVIVNRDPRALAIVRERYPQARLFLWLHDRIEPGGSRARTLRAHAATLAHMGVTLVCVSDWQRDGVAAALAGSAASAVTALTVYNPIADDLAPDATPVDERKLVFFSSPNKGLDYTLDAFAALRARAPELRLVVGNPGYKADRSRAPAGVEFLGAQPQARMHQEVRGALCTFFPNFLIPETFGLVFAESHALGTPVLTHDCGAALEVLGDRAEVLPLPAANRAYEALAGRLPRRWRGAPARLAGALGLFDQYAQTVSAWRAGARPSVRADERFRLSAVSARWRSLLMP